MKNRYKNRSKNRCLSRSIFDAIWVDFGKENGSKLAPRWCRKSNLSWKSRKARNAYKTISFIDFGGSGVPSWEQKSIENRSETKLTSEGILASIFDRFCRVWGGKLGGKIEPRANKNRSKKRIEKAMVKKVKFNGLRPSNRQIVKGRVASILPMH